MRFVVFTPLNPESAIGRTTAVLAKSLTQMDHDVALVGTDVDLSNSGVQDTPIFPNVDACSWRMLETVTALCNDADVVVYQIGNDYGFHGGAVEWLPHNPGIVILHDFVLFHLFAGWASVHSPAETSRVFRAVHPQANLQEVLWRFGTSTHSDEILLSNPMTEWICAYATGVLTHSTWGLDRVSASCPGPICVTPLYWPDHPVAIHDPKKTGTPLRVATLGHLNRNKKLDSLLQAIGNSRLLTDRVEAVHIGAVSDTGLRRELTTLAKRLNVKFSILENLEDEDYRKEISASDIVVALRWPPTQSSSATAWEALQFGKPLIVNSGHTFDEIPNDSCIRVENIDQPNELQTALEQLVNDDQLRSDIGHRGRAWLHEWSSAETYAQALVELSSLTLKSRSQWDFVDFIARELASWGLSPTSSCGSSVFHELTHHDK